MSIITNRLIYLYSLFKVLRVFLLHNKWVLGLLPFNSLYSLGLTIFLSLIGD